MCVCVCVCVCVGVHMCMTDYVVNTADITVSQVCLTACNVSLFSTSALSENCFRYCSLYLDRLCGSIQINTVRISLGI